MKSRIVSMLMLMATPLLMAAAALNFSYFPASSPLAQGKWVKIKVGDTGIYEITYDQLREMGFSDPKSVNIYGHGGRLLSENFTNVAGVPSHNGSVEQIPVIHGNNKIYFYGLGTEHISFESSSKYSTMGRFQRTSRNIYALEGSYLLSDQGSPMNMEMTSSIVPSSATEVTNCVDYIFHEEDIDYNPTSSGQLFWGETFSATTFTEKAFPVEFKNLEPDTKTYFQTEFHYIDTPLSTLEIGFPDTEEPLRLTVPSSQTYNFIPLSKAYTEFDAPQGPTSLNFKFEVTEEGGKGMLDWWMLTYTKTIPTLADEAQSRMTLYNIKLNNRFTFTLPNVNALYVLDVSSPLKPKIIPAQGNVVAAVASASYPSLMLFDAAQQQKQITGYEEIANQDLHSQATRGNDMLIITTKSYEEDARRLAALHEADGHTVMVAVDTDIYNEFSAGTPDPMAYKWLAKMMYEYKVRPLQNILFFGPMVSDIRGIHIKFDYDVEALIAYQSDNISRTTGAANVNDFYGILSNYSSYNTWERQMNVGVGVLPIASHHEASQIIDKIARYLVDDTFAYRLNSLMHFSSSGDDHISDISGINSIARLDKGFNNSAIITPLVLDDYAGEDCRKSFLNILTQGNLFNIYYGHGDPTWISANDKFFSPTHMSLLRNDPLSFTLFAGCSLSNFDRGNSGIGKNLVTGTKYGLIGSILATRETYANENITITDAFVDAILEAENGATIGKIFARGKSMLNLAHEHQYQLVCDPQLVLPFPYLSLEVDPEMLVPDENNFLNLHGRILDKEGNHIITFNGEVVAKILDLPLVKDCGNYLSKDTGKLEITYDNRVITVASGEAKQGNYTIKVRVPAGYAVDGNFKGSLALSAYDRALHVGAASRYALDCEVAQAAPTDKADTTAPSVNMEYFPETNVMNVTLTDNVCLNLSSIPLQEGITFRLDGKLLPSYCAGIKYVNAETTEVIYGINMPAISDGYHTLLVDAYDAAGNLSTEGLTFLVGAESPALALSMKQPAARDYADFTVEGDIPSGGLWMMVADPKGNTVARVSVEQNEFRWETTDALSFGAVKPGLHTAWLVSKDPAQSKYSTKTVIPVLNSLD